MASSEFKVIYEEGKSFRSSSSGSNSPRGITYNKLELNQKLDDMTKAINGYKSCMLQNDKGSSKFQSVYSKLQVEQPVKKELTKQSTKTLDGLLDKKYLSESPKPEQQKVPPLAQQQQYCEIQREELHDKVLSNISLNNGNVLHQKGESLAIPAIILQTITPSQMQNKIEYAFVDQNNNYYSHRGARVFQPLQKSVNNNDDQFSHICSPATKIARYKQCSCQHSSVKSPLKEVETIPSHISPFKVDDDIDHMEKNAIYQSLSPDRAKRQITATQIDAITEYQQMIERLHYENNDLKSTLNQRDRELAVLKTELDDHKSKAEVHQKIEQGLKEKIHQMQTEYYASNRDEFERQDEQDQLNSKLSEMQDILQNLESKFDITERELNKTKKENYELEVELQKQTKERTEYFGQIQQSSEIIERHQLEIKSLHAEITNLGADCLFYKEKYSEMQNVIEGCRTQMYEFDNVNTMSSQLIDQLQQEVSHYKKQLHQAQDQLRQADKNYLELLQTKSDANYQTSLDYQTINNDEVLGFNATPEKIAYQQSFVERNYMTEEDVTNVNCPKMMIVENKYQSRQCEYKNSYNNYVNQTPLQNKTNNLNYVQSFKSYESTMNESSIQKPLKPERDGPSENIEGMRRQISCEALSTLEQNIARLESEHEKVSLISSITKGFNRNQKGFGKRFDKGPPILRWLKKYRDLDKKTEKLVKRRFQENTIGTYVSEKNER